MYTLGISGAKVVRILLKVCQKSVKTPHSEIFTSPVHRFDDAESFLLSFPDRIEAVREANAQMHIMAF